MLPILLIRCGNTQASASLVVLSHCTSSSMILNGRVRSFSCAFSVGNKSGLAEGSSTICA